MYEFTKWFGIFITIMFVWFLFEIWRAPMMDEQTGKIIRPGKTLKDLFKKRK